MRSWIGLATCLLVGCKQAPAVDASLPQQPIDVASPREPYDAIAAFWSWWAEARPRYETSGGISQSLRDELNRRVTAIHPKLVWEIGGKPGHFELTVSAAGSFTLRKLTNQWARAAPPTPGWSYVPAHARRDDVDFTMRYGDRDLRFGETRFAFSADESRARLHVRAFHPAFKAAPESFGTEVTFLFLDTLIGEDDVERWLGRIEATGDLPPDAVEPLAFRAALDRFKQLAPKHNFVLFREKPGGTPQVTTIDVALKRLDHLEHDWHLEVTIPYLATRADGLPDKDEHAAGYDLEEALAAALGTTAVKYGHVIREGRLTIQFYAPQREPVDATLVRWTKEHPGRAIRHAWTHDPEWQRHGSY